METKKYRFDEVTINFDKKRIPLSSAQREKRQGTFRYYGAQGVIDHVDDYIYDGTYLLIAEDGENLKSKKQNIAQVVDGQFWVNNHAHIVQGNEQCDTRFLCYLINSMDLSGYVTGSAQPKLSQANLNAITLSLPTLVEQKRIVEYLYMLDQKIDVNRQINDNLLDQAQTLYKQHFPYSVQDDLPDGWRIGTVGEIIEIHDSKRIPLSGADRMKMEKKIYPYYGAASLMDYVDNYIFDGKYLLLGEDGTVVDDAGYPILQYVWGQFWVNNHAHILTGRLGFNVESLYMLFKQTPVKSIVTGAVQPKISQANLRSVQVVIPPEHNLKEYNDLVEPLFSLLRANEEEYKSLAALRDTLLPKLMSGEIDVSAVQL
jgi:type I restriction enzyme S subunit